ncbi:pentatricopeptide repeat-containing protein At1g06270 [Magnolia sinica]|uniref:pentatricopeptide repeat-containing protein At1g06270 n=1 Tax=Magnolia sinica TaxID=86752 RepID=UPI0026597479|nr:pentatricopeptide repeat-containing protein At1g06270 [Magnolia sinica]
MSPPTSLYKTLFLSLPNTRRFNSIPSSPTTQTLQDSIRTAIETKNFHQILHLLSSSKCPKPPHKIPENPFSFLSSFPQPLQTQIIDEILQSFIPLRPRSLPFPAYSLLLSYTLQKSPISLPLSLAVLQSTLRSGCPPALQTRLSLSVAWLDCRRSGHRKSVAQILSEVRAIGYSPDRTTCNYLLSSLCAVDELAEAVAILRDMRGAGCEPDSESYGAVIAAACEARRTDAAAELVREMVAELRLTPRQGTVVRIVAAMRANREVLRAAEMVEFLEREGCGVGFQSHEMVVEGCLERKEFVAAGKAVMEMAGRGFIPYIHVRQKVVEGLTVIGERDLASAVRRKLAELSS